MQIDRLELLCFAVSLADAAQVEILRYYRSSTTNYKADGSEVTEADRRAEEVVREAIVKRFPSHSILGEEFGEVSSISLHNRNYQWVIDPLDGTTWFTLGVPLFGTLIAFLENGEPTVGVIHFPLLGETVYAGKGLGCWFRVNEGNSEVNAQIYVQDRVRLENAVVSASGIHGTGILALDNVPKFNLTSVIRRAKRFRFCGDCMQHALVCRGNIHAAIDTVMQPWDIAAIIPCIEEAGGIATSLNGERDNIVFSGSLLTSCDDVLHRELLRRLRASGPASKKAIAEM